MKDLRPQLKKKSKEWLINQLFELALADDKNADRISLSLSADTDGDTECAAKFKNQLDKAAEQMVEHGPGSWKSQLPTSGFDMVADALAVMLPTKLKVVIETSEHALLKLDSIFELQDECELEYLVDAFRDLHLEACFQLKPDPLILGARLAEMVNETEWGFFDGPPDKYRHILGKEGLAVYLSNIS